MGILNPFHQIGVVYHLILMLHLPGKMEKHTFLKETSIGDLLIKIKILVILNPLKKVNSLLIPQIRNHTGCLITDPTKVEAFYAHFWRHIWTFWIINSKITLLHLLSIPENG